MKQSWWKAAIPVCVGLVLWLLPRPAEVAAPGWALPVIFVATVTTLITQPLPMAAIAVIGSGCVIMTKVLTVDTALAAFGTPIVWIIAAICTAT